MTESHDTEASRYLIALAKQNAQVYAALPTLRAILLTGSASEGESDFYSDIDTILYYDELPSETALVAAAEHNGGSDRRLLAPRSDEGLIESYQVHGVECQFAHSTVASWENEMNVVLEKLEVETPIQKALGGLLDAIPLYGEALIRQWQAKAADYPDALAVAMVQHYLTFSPLWGMQGRLNPRDATIWIRQILVDNCHHLLGVLAGLNHLYFSTFQFKRMRRFIDKMSIAPPDLADRLDGVFEGDPMHGAEQIEALVRDTLPLVEQHMPQVDTTRVRQRIGWRQEAWQPVAGIIST